MGKESSHRRNQRTSDNQNRMRILLRSSAILFASNAGALLFPAAKNKCAIVFFDAILSLSQALQSPSSALQRYSRFIFMFGLLLGGTPCILAFLPFFLNIGLNFLEILVIRFIDEILVIRFMSMFVLGDLCD